MKLPFKAVMYKKGTNRQRPKARFNNVYIKSTALYFLEETIQCNLNMTAFFLKCNYFSQIP